MGVSAVGQPGLSMRSMRSFLFLLVLLIGVIVYFYGPLVTPTVASAAQDECNEHAGGNFRSYRLEWVSGPGNRPHWSCWDASRPRRDPVDLGWWVNPFS